MVLAPFAIDDTMEEEYVDTRAVNWFVAKFLAITVSGFPPLLNDPTFGDC